MNFLGRDSEREILEPPLRERVRVERALRRLRPGNALPLTCLIESGKVRGDWRRTLVRKRIEELLVMETSATSASLR